MNISQLKQQLHDYCEKNRLFGMLRVTHRDQILLEQNFGYADVTTREPFTKDSLFTLYSLSKPFCAIGLMLLVDQGLVALDAHPGKYLPEAKDFDCRVTLRQLLQHTSGIPDFAPQDGYLQELAPGYSHKSREHVALLSRYPQFFAPGTNERYSNAGYILCALIIENVSGLLYADYMRQRVFTPLGMKTAVVDHEALEIPHRVQGHALNDGQVIPVPKCHDWALGAGDILGTLDDVYCLNKAIKHRLLLSAESWEEILTPSPLNQKGLGCTVTQKDGQLTIRHNGGNTGFRTMHIQHLENDFDFILLSNSGYCNEGRITLYKLIKRAFFNDSATADPLTEMDKGYI